MKRRLSLAFIAGVSSLILLLSVGQGSVARPEAKKDKVYPEAIHPKIKEAQEKNDVKWFDGVVDSVVAQPPYVAFGVLNGEKKEIMGFLIPNAEDKKQEYVLKVMLLAFEQKKKITVSYKDGGEVYGVTVR